jgi:two-component system, OmpR family, sensor histidine kinase KdpD
VVPTSRPERLVVALTGGPEGRVLLERAAGIAGRAPGGELHSVYVARRGPGDAPSAADLAGLRQLTEDLGGTHHTLAPAVGREDPATAVLDFARGIDATQVVVGVSRRSRLRAALKAGVGDRVVAGSGDMDVLMVSHPLAGGVRGGPAPGSALGVRRRAGGWALAVLGPTVLTVLTGSSSHLPTSQALCYLALTVLCALVGGLWPALTAAVLGSLLLNYFFTSPVRTLRVDDADNVVALVLFLVVAVAVASVVDVSARRSVQADRARREADALSLLNRALLRSGYGVEELLVQVCETLQMSAATLLRSRDDGGWVVVARRGLDAPVDASTADAEAEAHAGALPQTSRGVRLLLRGRPMAPHELRVLSAFATHLAVVLERAELAEQAAAADRLAQGNRLRTALLAAVSHDLRTPLAGIKAAVTTLRAPDLRWTEEDADALLGAIEDSTDRLAGIIANLLDMSRLQTGGITLAVHEVGLEDVVARAVAGLPGEERVLLDLPDDLPTVLVDAGLLDRVVVNLVDNALRHTASSVEVRGAAADGRVRLLVVDHGPGVPDPAKATLFEPFQRLGDAPSGEGVGLGLAVARGLTEAMGGTVAARDTAPGGPGLTMTVDLPAVGAARAPADHELVQP